MSTYNFHDYDDARPNVGVTACLFIYEDFKIKVLTYKRDGDSEQFPEYIALPNRFFDRRLFNTAEQAVYKALEEKAHVYIPYIEQLKTYSGDYIDPERITTINIGYFALTTRDEVENFQDNDENVLWVNVEELIENHEMAFNHKEILKDAYERVRSKSEYSPISCHLLGEKFTIRELKEITEHLLGETLDNSRFRDRIKKTNLLKPVNGEFKKGANRPAQIYQINERYNGCFYPKSMTKPE